MLIHCSQIDRWYKVYSISTKAGMKILGKEMETVHV